jgi:hypothetical protein
MYHNEQGAGHQKLTNQLCELPGQEQEFFSLPWALA